jgi:hypothetical protein
VLELFRLIDWLLVLPEDLAVAFQRELRDYELQKAMPYVTSIERLGRQEGRQEGRVQTLREDITDILEVRFHEVPPALWERIQGLQDETELKRLHRRAVQVRALDEFTRECAAPPA